MKRRQFLKNLASGSAAGLEFLPSLRIAPAQPALTHQGDASVSVEGQTFICEFQFDQDRWKIYEDLSTRDGSITFVSSHGRQRVLTKSAEATFAEADPPYLGLKLSDIGMAGPDLLAEKLLKMEIRMPSW